MPVLRSIVAKVELVIDSYLGEEDFELDAKRFGSFERRRMQEIAGLGLPEVGLAAAHAGRSTVAVEHTIGAEVVVGNNGFDSPAAGTAVAGSSFDIAVVAAEQVVPLVASRIVETTEPLQNSLKDRQKQELGL